MTVVNQADRLIFRPTASHDAGLIFICGSGISADAYAPLLRPVAEAGYAVYIVKLPYRFAPLESQKESTVNRVHRMIATHSPTSRWVVAGHSLGAALACRVVRSAPADVSALVLIGSAHPKDFDLSSLRIPVTKVFASNDGIAPIDRILANKGLLPKSTKWVEIKGGNHSQFGCYGHQLLDGNATISREKQQSQTRAVLLDALAATLRR